MRDMDIFGMVLGWNWKVKRTRRRWDRLRERTLGKGVRARRRVLRELDVIEEKLRMLEEEKLSRRDRTRILGEVQGDLANIARLLKRGGERPPDTERHLSERHRESQYPDRKPF